VSRYLEILAVDRPADIGQDDNDRTVFAINFQSMSVGDLGDFEAEIVRAIISNGLATALGTDIFIGTSAKLPTQTLVITVIATGGLGRDITHNGDNYERPSCQVAVRARSYVAARDRAVAIWRALDGLRNFDVTA